MTEEELKDYLYGLGFRGKRLAKAITVVKSESFVATTTGPLSKPDATQIRVDRPSDRCYYDPATTKWVHNTFMHQGCMLR